MLTHIRQVKRKSKAGVTLIELLVALALLAILVVPVQRIYLQAVRYTHYNALHMEASNAGASLAARLRNQNSLDLTTNANLGDYDIEYPVGEDYSELKPKSSDKDFFLRFFLQSPEFYHVPGAGYALGASTEAASTERQLTCGIIEVYTSSSTTPLTTFYVSVID